MNIYLALACLSPFAVILFLYVGIGIHEAQEKRQRAAYLERWREKCIKREGGVWQNDFDGTGSYFVRDSFCSDCPDELIDEYFGNKR